jgi:hypothetical protein
MALVERANIGAEQGGSGPISAGVVTTSAHPKVDRPSMPPPPFSRSQMQTSKAGLPSLGIETRPLPTIYKLDFHQNLSAGVDLGTDVNLGFPFDAGGGAPNIDFDHDLDLEPNLELDAMLLRNSSADLNAITHIGDWGSFTV